MSELRTLFFNRLDSLQAKSSWDAALMALGVLALLFLGILMVFNISSAEEIDRGRVDLVYSATKHHVIYAVSGLIWAFSMILIGYERILKLLPYLFWGCCFLLLLVYLPGIGVERNGAKRWISLMGYTLQPSEFAKLLVPTYLAYCLRDMKKHKDFRYLLKILVQVTLPLGLIVLEPDNRTTALIMSALVVVCFLTKLPWKLWLLPLMIFALAASTLALQLNYVQKRIAVYFEPESDLSGRGYQPMQAKVAIGAGGISGRGLGQSMQKFSFLPEAQNDYMAAIIAEELGFIGICSVISIYLMLITLCIRIAVATQNSFAALITGIVTYMFGIQIFINLGVVSGLLPSTGLNLALVSQGGSSLWANLIAFGFLTSVALEAPSALVSCTPKDPKVDC